MKPTYIFKVLVILLAFHFNFTQATIAQEDHPKMDEEDRIRLSEAFKIGHEFGKDIWNIWENIPFATILVEEEYEFLMHHPNPPQDFIKLGKDELIDAEIYYRPRTFSTHFLSVLPKFNGVATIVIGKPENTKLNSTEWILKLLREHFFQLQMAQNNYFEDLHSLQIDPQDTTLAWVHFYKFPYREEELNVKFEELSSMLLHVLETESQKESKKFFKKYNTSREEFKSMLSESNYKYFSFKVWHDGVADYCELRFARLAASKHKTSEALKAIPDFVPFETMQKKIFDHIHKELEIMSLGSYRRSALQGFGAAEAILLDKLEPHWHNRYFSEKFFIEKYFKKWKTK